jgi:electron transport complex protein RnfG
MGEILKLGFVLMVVALVAAVALGFVNSRTEPVIEEQQRQQRLEAMMQVAGSLSETLPAEEMAYDTLALDANPYAAVDESLTVVRFSSPAAGPLGYTFIAYGKGYSSTVQTMVAVDLNGTVRGATILFQQETPGLGAKCETGWVGQMVGKTAADCSVVKDGGGVESITGATITSRAVSGSIRTGLDAMESEGLFEGGGEL